MSDATPSRSPTDRFEVRFRAGRGRWHTLGFAATLRAALGLVGAAGDYWFHELRTEEDPCPRP